MKFSSIISSFVVIVMLVFVANNVINAQATTNMPTTTTGTTLPPARNELYQCDGGCDTNCTLYKFHNNTCFNLNDATSVIGLCGAMTTCATGTFYKSTDCSGKGEPFSTECTATSKQCETLGSTPDYTYFQCDSSGVRAAIACGFACSSCVAMSPTIAYGSCLSLPSGSINFDKSFSCRGATLKAFADTCSDAVSSASMPIGNENCRATSEVTGSQKYYKIDCKDPLPTPAPPITTSTPLPTAKPKITHVTCSDNACKTDCKPTIIQSEVCIPDGTPKQQKGSFIAFCSTYIITRFFNSSTCTGSGSNVYVTPSKCYPGEGGVGSWYETCS